MIPFGVRRENPSASKSRFTRRYKVTRELPVQARLDQGRRQTDIAKLRPTAAMARHGRTSARQV